MLTQEMLWRAATAVGWFGNLQEYNQHPEGKKHLEAIAAVLRWAVAGGSFLAGVLSKMEEQDPENDPGVAFLRRFSSCIPGWSSAKRRGDRQDRQRGCVNVVHH
jgi:hypothetical protein